MTNLRSKTIIAALWSVVGGGGRGVIRFVSNLILTRLLFPEAFGQIATAMVIMTLVQLFSDTGIKTALIQNLRGNTPQFINTAFIISLVRSVVLFVVVLVFVQPLASFYNQPVLKELLLIMSFSFLAEGLLNPALPILIKTLKIQRQVIYSIGSQFAGFIATLVLVYNFRSVNALAVGFLLTSIFRVFFSYIVIPYKPNLSWDKEAWAELFNFGKYIILNTMIAWAVMNLDRLIIGRVLNMEQAGFYSIAIYIGIFISEVLSQVFAQSYFPAISSLGGDVGKVQQVYSKTLGVVLSFVIPGIMLIALFSSEIISLLYDPRYQLAGVALFWVALKSMVNVISDVQSGTLIALGKPKYVTTINSLGLALLLFTLPEITARYGLVGSGVTIFGLSLILGVLQSGTLIIFMDFQPRIVLKPWFQLIALSFAMACVYQMLMLVGQFIQLPQFLLMFLMGLVSLFLVLILNRQLGTELQNIAFSRVG